MKYILSILTCVLSVMAVQGQELIEFVEFAEGLVVPVDITNAGGDQLYVVEKPGTIALVNPDGSVVSDKFLDIEDRVNDQRSEQGLLGMVFHPDYPTEPYFFVNYTGNNDGETVIARFTVDPLDPSSVDPDTEKIILTFDQPFWNHNAGDLLFGPDGYLYIPSGDGGSGGDPQGNGQDLMTMLGKILRIDIDTDEPYLIPSDNPFADDDFANDEIWAYGLRNPWRIDFDPMTGDLYIGDVGQNKYEEIDFQPAGSAGGENYGWRCYEADSIFNDTGCNLNGLTFPAHTYERPSPNVCASVTGGVVYYGPANPNFTGKYLFSDWCTGMFSVMYRDGAGEWMVDTLLDESNISLSTFGRGSDGEVYVADASKGRIYTIKDKTVHTTTVDNSVNFLIQNPVSNELNIDNNFSFSGGSIYNNQGHLVQYINKKERVIQVNDWPNGIYFIQLESEGVLYNRRFMVLN